jgi:hypothetical protein
MRPDAAKNKVIAAVAMVTAIKVFFSIRVLPETGL